MIWLFHFALPSVFALLHCDSACIKAFGHILTHKKTHRVDSKSQVVQFSDKHIVFYIFSCKNDWRTTNHIFPCFFRQDTPTREERIKSGNLYKQLWNHVKQELEPQLWCYTTVENCEMLSFFPVLRLILNSWSFTILYELQKHLQKFSQSFFLSLAFSWTQFSLTFLSRRLQFFNLSIWCKNQ